jgi:hypothetical protein
LVPFSKALARASLISKEEVPVCLQSACVIIWMLLSHRITLLSS